MSLIKQSQLELTNANNLVEHLDQIGVLVEDVTHVLANIAVSASDGQPLKVMHLSSVAAFMAGVDLIANKLHTITDQPRKAATLKMLAAAGVGSDGFVTTAVAPIAQAGVRNPVILTQYKDMVSQYMASIDARNPNGDALAKSARKLQHQIDRAVRLASSSS